VNEVSVVDQSKAATEASGKRRTNSAPFKRWLREPLVHFLLIGIAVFAIYAYMNRGRGGFESSRQITVTLEELQQMDMYFVSQWHRQPTPAELQTMVEDKVREEVLYREAMAMNLDKDDTIVKRRMAQKMQFIAEDVAAAHEPSTAELKAWFQKDPGRFSLPSRYSFRHLYFSPDKRGKNTQDDAAKTLARIAGEPENSKLALSLGDPFMFQDYYGDRAPEALAKEFGPQFVMALEKLKPGSWQGPIESGYGWHLVYIDTVIPGRIPAFEELESDIKTAWLGEQKRVAWQKAYKDMRDKYTVLMPVPSDQGATPPPVSQPQKQVPVPSGEGPL